MAYFYKSSETSKDVSSNPYNKTNCKLLGCSFGDFHFLVMENDLN